MLLLLLLLLLTWTSSRRLVDGQLALRVGEDVSGSLLVYRATGRLLDDSIVAARRGSRTLDEVVVEGEEEEQNREDDYQKDDQGLRGAQADRFGGGSILVVGRIGTVCLAQVIQVWLISYSL